jgi:hypothetical protein
MQGQRSHEFSRRQRRDSAATAHNFLHQHDTLVCNNVTPHMLGTSMVKDSKLKGDGQGSLGMLIHAFSIIEFLSMYTRMLTAQTDTISFVE